MVVETILDQIDYSSSLINHVNDSTVDVNINQGDDNDVRPKPKVLIIPEIVISESRDEPGVGLNMPLVIPRPRSSDISDSNNENVSQQSESVSTVSDNCVEDIEQEGPMPQISKLLGEYHTLPHANIKLFNTHS